LRDRFGDIPIVGIEPDVRRRTLLVSPTSIR
jgi:hypothetical protein